MRWRAPARLPGHACCARRCRRFHTCEISRTTDHTNNLVLGSYLGGTKTCTASGEPIPTPLVVNCGIHVQSFRISPRHGHRDHLGKETFAFLRRQPTVLGPGGHCDRWTLSSLGRTILDGSRRNVLPRSGRRIFSPAMVRRGKRLLEPALFVAAGRGHVRGEAVPTVGVSGTARG